MFKKTVSIFMMIVLILTYLPSGLVTKANLSSEVTNVALQAVASTTAGSRTNNNISSIIDGDDTYGWASADATLPQDVILDWGQRKVKTSQISLLVNYGPHQGITRMDIDYFDGTTWQTARSDVDIDWKLNQQKAETVDIFFPEVETSKIRLHVKDANFTWQAFVIIELKVWGTPVWTAEDVAEQITEIVPPARGETQLRLPSVPDGFEARIYSSDREDLLSTNGTIILGHNEANITLVLEIVKLSDQSRALTMPIQVTVPGIPPIGYEKITPVEDMTSIIKNPAMGWMLYVEEIHSLINADRYWNLVDPYIEPASILYFRVPWSRMEPNEGVYAWNIDDNYKKLVSMARERNLKLAFRVTVDSQDLHMQATPQFVFDAGAQGYPTQSNPGFQTPILTDPIFREKFENFVTAFAQQYDDPDIVDFIDAQGLGWWGEMHNIKHLNKEQMDDTFIWITNLYSSKFTNILLGGQYGNQFDDELEEWAISEKGYMIRRDSYGSPVHFPQGAKDKINAHWPKVPVFAENCYQTFVSWPGSCDGNTRPIRDMLTRVVNDALDTHANTLDLRHPEDVKEWVTNHADLVNQFAIQGGYRFVLSEAYYPATMEVGQIYSIYHSWKNTAVGKLPNDMPNWGNKYKVAFALLDRNTDMPVYMSIDSAEPSDWIQGRQYDYTGALDLEGIAVGSYDVAVAIVDSTKNNEPAITLAVRDIVTNTGWYKLGTVTVTSTSEEPGVDKSALSELINVAQSTYDAAVEGTDPGQYPPGSKQDLLDAIEASTIVLNDDEATESDVNEAMDALNHAIDNFQKLIIVDSEAPYWNDNKILTASHITENELILSWSGAEDSISVTGYKIYMNAAELATVTANVYHVSTSTVTGNVYHVSGLSPATTYHFKVEAGNDAGKWSVDGPSVTVITANEADLVAPVWPENTTASAANATTNSVILIWTPATDNVGITAYRVTYGDHIINVDGNTNTVRITGLSSGTKYTFHIVAGDAAGNWSENGPVVVVWTESPPFWGGW